MLRATAITEEGKEANDIKMLRGPSMTVESVRVDVVQLHVSALDKEGRFVQGLAKEDFAVKEDGKPQPMTGFEVAENLPLTVGLVVDSSGSMEKSMPYVHDAGAALFKNLIRAKDQGFVIEFREQAKFLQEMTGDSNSLQRAARDIRAGGATALYDAIVLGLYQFRTQQGRKALDRHHGRRGQLLPCRVLDPAALRPLGRGARSTSSASGSRSWTSTRARRSTRSAGSRAARSST